MFAFLIACSIDTAAPTAAATTADLGAEVWTERCAPCHGVEGRGDGPVAAGLSPKPKDLSRPRLPEERRPPSRMEVIRSGREGTAMVGFATQLSPEELTAVTTHVQALAHDGAAMPCPAGGGGGGGGQGRRGSGG